MRVLVAGGTKFVGRHLVDLLLADGHDVTLFNRGLTNPALFPGAARIAGDRADPPEALGGRDWDWVFDVSGQTAEDVGRLGRRVAARTGRYVFVSTASVYRDRAGNPGIDEDGELWPVTPASLADGSPSAYGARKTAAEAAVWALAVEAGMEAAVVRPVLVYGPWDLSDRCGYWLHRVRAGAVVVPEAPAGFRHTVYVKDLARILAAAAKARGAAGRTYNAASTRHHTVEDWIGTAAEVAGVRPVVRRVSWDALRAAGATGLPGVGVHPGADWTVSSARIQRELGFTSTPFAQTLAECYAHMAAEGRAIKEAIPLDGLARLLS